MTFTSPRDVSGNTSTHSDLVLHLTGEMTNPTLLENFITEHPMVHAALLFGHGRYNAGMLIELEDAFKIDAHDPNQVAETRQKLQYGSFTPYVRDLTVTPRLAIERMNVFAPQHARVQKEMILFASPAKPFIYDAARVNRRDTLAEYTSEIDALYATVSRATQIPLNPPKVWSPQNALIYVRGVILSVLSKEFDDNADLFDHGVDSLQATRIRVILYHALQRTARVDTRKLAGNIVRQYPTIAGLATFATRTTLECLRSRTEASHTRCLGMREMVTLHTMDYPIHKPSSAPPCDEVVLITGTTGLLGSHLLAQFLQCAQVEKVYALNRKKSRPVSVVDKQAALLHAWGLDPALARHPKLTLLDGDGGQSHLGLPQDVYGQLVSSVTHIVHGAWLSTHDDNLSLRIFDGSFRMLRNLVDLALASPFPTPPRLLFISTTDASRTSASEAEAQIPLAGLASVCDAAGSLHAASKWVGEQILASAASCTALRPTVVRIRPLSGGANGRWHDDALFPKIVHLGAALGALPHIDEVVHWVPVDTVARAVCDMRDTMGVRYVHGHPTPVEVLLRQLGEELHLPLVSLPQWSARLAEGVQRGTLHDDAALILLRHLHRAEVDGSTRVFGHGIREGAGEAESLALGIEDVRRWVRHWREVGLVTAS